MKFSSSFHTLVTITGLAIACIHAQLVSFGRCPTHSVVDDFNITEYLGRWYEIERHYAIFEADSICVQAYYSSGKEDGTMRVVNSQIHKKNRQMKNITGTAQQISTNGNGRFAVTPDSSPYYTVSDFNYWVVATDYKNYSLVWSCTEMLLFHLQIVWFLARERDPSKELKQLVYDKMDNNGLRRDIQMKTKQTSCDI